MVPFIPQSPLSCVHVIEPQARFVTGGSAAKKWAALTSASATAPAIDRTTWPWLTVSFAAVPSNKLSLRLSRSPLHLPKGILTATSESSPLLILTQPSNHTHTAICRDD